jgi:MmyB-like transcription regulator ligand binding domain
MTTTPAFVRNNRLDILATNPLARGSVLTGSRKSDHRSDRHPNLARFQFLDIALASQLKARLTQAPPPRWAAGQMGTVTGDV